MDSKSLKERVLYLALAAGAAMGIPGCGGATNNNNPANKAANKDGAGGKNNPVIVARPGEKEIKNGAPEEADKGKKAMPEIRTEDNRLIIPAKVDTVNFVKLNDGRIRAEYFSGSVKDTRLIDKNTNISEFEFEGGKGENVTIQNAHLLHHGSSLKIGAGMNLVLTREATNLHVEVNGGKVSIRPGGFDTRNPNQAKFAPADASFYNGIDINQTPTDTGSLVAQMVGPKGQNLIITFPGALDYGKKIGDVKLPINQNEFEFSKTRRDALLPLREAAAGRLPKGETLRLPPVLVAPKMPNPNPPSKGKKAELPGQEPGLNAGGPSNYVAQGPYTEAILGNNGNSPANRGGSTRG